MLTRAEAEARSVDRSSSPARWKPEWWTFTSDGQRYWVKDLRRCASLFRYTLGRFTLGHKARVYRQMNGVGCVPGYLGQFDRDSLVLMYVDAQPLKMLRSHEDLPPGFLEDLERAVAAMHAHGVVHMDLRHRSNILVATDGSPVLSDLESALHFGRFTRWLMPLFAWIDHSAVLKYRLRYVPEQVSAAEHKQHRRHERLHRLWVFGRLWPPPWRRRRKA